MQRFPVSLAFALAAALAAGFAIGPRPAAAQHRVSFQPTWTDPRGAFGPEVATFSGPGLAYLHDLGAKGRWAVGAAAAGGTYGSAPRPLLSAVPLLDLRATTHSRMVFFLALVEYRPTRGSPVEPWIEGAVGHGEAFTETEVVCENCSETTRFLVDDLASGGLVAGGGGGLRVRIHQRVRGGGPSGIPDDPLRVDLELGLRWLRGGRVRYLSEDPAFDADGTLLPGGLREDRLEVLQYRAGVSVAF